MSTQRVSGGLFTAAARTGIWLALIGLSGCAQSPARSLARAWNDAPKIRWTKVPETPPEKKAAESKVAANTPSGKSKAGEASASNPRRNPARVAQGKTQESTDKRTIAQSRSHAGPHDPFLDEEQADARRMAKKKLKPTVDRVSEEPEVVSARDRLRATMSDDTRRQVVPVADVGEHEQVRLRIESLMNRAKAHCEEDQWVAARRAAELAQSLAESFGMEFDPDDERPIELLTFINSRLEATADAAQQGLAENEASDESEEESSDADETPTQVVKSASRTSVPRIPLDSAAPFDPYAQNVALAHLDENQNGHVFGPSMVVLESPSFEDDAEVSPMAFSRSTERLRTRKRFSLKPPIAAADAEPAEEEIPSPPEEDAASAGEIELPEPTDALEDVAPSPPIEEPSGPALVPMLTAADDIEPSAAAADSRPAAIEEDIQPAGLWPRWMSFSLLSLLTAGFCFWLWRRQTRTAG